MSSINSFHAAGRAAYTQRTSPSQSRPDAQPSSEPDGASDVQEASNEATLQESDDDPLTARERKAIAENFPANPELSMRLYGRSRGTQTVNPDARGGNLDVTG